MCTSAHIAAQGTPPMPDVQASAAALPHMACAWRLAQMTGILGIFVLK